MKKLLFCLGIIACFNQSLQAKTLIFATEATYPPFVSLTATDKMIGFGPDIVHAICKQMHQQCKLVNAAWDSLIPSLKMHKYDALFGGMAITQQRLHVVDFSQPYYQNGITFVVNKNSHFSVSKKWLKGKIIGVQGGTTFEQYIKDKYGNLVTLKTYASNMTALLDLKSARVDAVFIDKPVATVWLKKTGNQAYISVGNIQDIKLFGPGNAIATNKDNTTLKNAINKAISTLKKSGQLKQIQEKWFGKTT